MEVFRMFSYCLLCAEEKKSTELMTSILDPVCDIKRKLIACYQWKPSFEKENMPQYVCSHCVEDLNRCCTFIERISIAEQKLLNIIASKNDLQIEQLIWNENGNNFVEFKEDFFCDAFYTDNCIGNEFEIPETKLKESSHQINSVEAKAECMPIENVVFNECKPKCNHCGKIFLNEERLRKHDRIVCFKEGSSAEQFQCDICKSKYSHKSTLRQHMNKHSSKMNEKFVENVILIE